MIQQLIITILVVILVILAALTVMVLCFLAFMLVTEGVRIIRLEFRRRHDDWDDSEEYGS